jgi:DNA topoisomerase I
MTSGHGRTIEQIIAPHDDAEACARAAGLHYVCGEDAGIRRVRRGRGFSYRDQSGAPVSPKVRRRIEALVIPPAWQEVWICLDADAHLLATGTDERGRRQYLYNERWRVFRDELNFHRLTDFGPRLPSIRAGIDKQLRGGTFDRKLVLAAIVRIIDVCGLRVGSEEYVEENDSYGLTTLAKRHVQVHGSTVQFDFPGKSGKRATATLDDAAVARVIGRLEQQRGRRLFAVDGTAISAAEVNERLADLADARVTAKDFRTWHGTRVAFAVLRKRLPAGGDAERRVLEAVDAAAEFLGNTRAVARTHYVHPHLLDAYLDGTFQEVMSGRRAVRTAGLDADERVLVPFLEGLLVRARL